MIKVIVSDNDSPWKEILDRYFRHFMDFFFPIVYEAIDWSKGHEFIDKELQKIAPDAETGRRTVDKLVKVWLKNGTEVWTAVHIEIQGKSDPRFAERMYVYHYRLFDKYHRNIISLAVLADARKTWRPNRFAYDCCGCRLQFHFLMVKLLDYADRMHVLATSKNPFTVVVMTHLKGLETTNDIYGRYAAKLRLIKDLYGRGLGREDIVNLFRFIDWIMILPSEMEQRLTADLNRFEKEGNMPYVSTIERLAIERGLKQGLQQGLQRGLQKGMAKGKAAGLTEGMRKALQNVIFDTLKLRFGKVGRTIRSTVSGIQDINALKRLHQHAVFCETLSDFQHKMVEINGDAIQ